MNMHINPDELLSAVDTASELHQQPNTLACWRNQGKGPAYVKVGRQVFYRRQEHRGMVGEATARTAAPHCLNNNSALPLRRRRETARIPEQKQKARQPANGWRATGPSERPGISTLQLGIRKYALHRTSSTSPPKSRHHRTGRRRLRHRRPVPQGAAVAGRDVRFAIARGQRLKAKQESLPHGAWLPWLRDYAQVLGFESRTPQTGNEAAANTMR